VVFDREVKIRVKGGGLIRVEVYDVTGRYVRGLEGRGEVIWEGRDFKGVKVSSGVYFLNIYSSDDFIRKKVIRR